MNNIGLEHWLDIAGYEGFYQISDQGRVRSVSRRVQHGNGELQIKSRFLSLQTMIRGGYASCVLYRFGAGENARVHILVAVAFIGPRPKGQIIRHLDGNPKNNRVSNLAWGTQSENLFDTVRHGRHRGANKTQCKLAHLLTEPNLVPSVFKEGRRSCLACSRARSEVQRFPEKNRQQCADEHYLQIMEGVV